VAHDAVTHDADAELRAARRERVFAAMGRGGLDALVLGRRDSVAYATGVRSLWTAGTRAFGAAAVLVAEGQRVHLLSTWDAGVPPEIPFDHLYGVTWNPAVMLRSLGAIPGLADARRVGVDSLSVGFARLVDRLAPGADLVVADDLLTAVRATKLPAEVERIRAAVGVAAAGVDAAIAALERGSPPDDALAAARRALAAAGVTVPSSAPVVAPVGPVGPSGALVHVDLGVLVDGYDGGRGRTVAVDGAGAGAGPSAGGRRLAAARMGQQALVGACRPGATGADLRAASPAAVDRWIVRGAGMGFEPPVVTDALGRSAELSAGMVLSVEVVVDGAARRDLVLVGPAAPEVLGPVDA
jgi:Xaa-Pro dipeptidase